MRLLKNNLNFRNLTAAFFFFFFLLTLPLLVMGTLTVRDSRSNAAGEDITPPTVPSNVRAMSTVDGVKVFWGASTDAVGVAGYKVFRNGVYIGTAPYPYQEWPDLTAEPPYTNYSYRVRAYDAANNESGEGVMRYLRDCSLLDTSGDDAIDLTDTLQILNHFGEEGPAIATWDMNGDVAIDLSDALDNLNYFGEKCSLLSLSKSPTVAASTTSSSGKINQQIVLKPGQSVKVGANLTLSWDWTFEPTSDPGALAIVGRAVVGTESQYIGFVKGGTRARASDQAFGYSFSLKSATKTSATIHVKN